MTDPDALFAGTDRDSAAHCSGLPPDKLGVVAADVRRTGVAGIVIILNLTGPSVNNFINMLLLHLSPAVRPDHSRRLIDVFTVTAVAVLDETAAAAAEIISPVLRCLGQML